MGWRGWSVSGWRLVGGRGRDAARRGRRATDGTPRRPAAAVGAGEGDAGASSGTAERSSTGRRRRAAGRPAPTSSSRTWSGRYSLDIAPERVGSIMSEFNNLAQLLANGNDFVVAPPGRVPPGERDGQQRDAEAARPVVVGADRDARRQPRQDSIRLSFHQSDPNGKFHGVEKLVFDMPRSDWTFMHDRLAHAWLRQVGIAAGCAANAPRGDQRQLLRPLRRRGEHQQARHRRSSSPTTRAACGKRAISPRRRRPCSPRTWPAR